MRLPWLQVEQDGIAQCKRLARLLGTPERPVTDAQGIGIGVLTWQYAFEISPEGDFRGFVPDPGILAAEVGWPVEDAPNLVSKLQRVGIVATTPSLRVRGLDRYIRAWEKNSRKKAIYRDCGDAVPQPGANPAPLAPEAAPHTQTQTQTQTHTQKEQQKLAGLSPAAPKAKSRKPPKVEKPTDPRHAPLRLRLIEIFKAVRGAAYPFSSHDARLVTELLAMAEPEAIASAWARALGSGTFPTVSMLSELKQRFGHFVGTGPPAQQPKTPAFDPNQGIIRSGGPPMPSREDPFPWGVQR